MNDMSVRMVGSSELMGNRIVKNVDPGYLITSLSAANAGSRYVIGVEGTDYKESNMSSVCSD